MKWLLFSLKTDLDCVNPRTVLWAATVCKSTCCKMCLHILYLRFTTFFFKKTCFYYRKKHSERLCRMQNPHFCPKQDFLKTFSSVTTAWGSKSWIVPLLVSWAPAPCWFNPSPCQQIGYRMRTWWRWKRQGFLWGWHRWIGSAMSTSEGRSCVRGKVRESQTKFRCEDQRGNIWML